MLAIILFATEKLSVDVITLLPSEIVARTKPWHAAQESKRLGMEFGVFNGLGYETSDAPPRADDAGGLFLEGDRRRRQPRAITLAVVLAAS